MEASPDNGPVPGVRRQSLLLVGLSLSIGWGIRGNFGHQYGAALPGALAAMAAVLLSRREDWLRRIPFFAFFGAIGWAFGGTMSYMQVIGYTHSGDSLSVWYGFVCLFIIGFLWGAVGGAGTALPAFVSRERLMEFVTPLTAIFFTWSVEAALESHFIDNNPAFHGRDPLDWFDSNWISVLLAVVVMLILGAVRRRFTFADKLILSMAVGWWAGFLLLPVGLHIRMTPPRGDEWAGSVGMTIAMMVFLNRSNLKGVLYASLITGFIGGLGFATSTMFKLIEIKSGLDTNWHSILEQTYGLINGLGVAIMMDRLRVRAPGLPNEETKKTRWFEAAAVAFVLLFLTYINLQKEVDDWVHSKAMPEMLYFLSAHGWFDLFYALTAIAFLLLLREHLRRPLAVIPATWLGKGLMFYLVMLWWVVIGNFLKAVVSFAPQRLVTEGTIYFNALLCTVMVLLWARKSAQPGPLPTTNYGPLIRKTFAFGTVLWVLSTLLNWTVIRAIWGDQPSGYANLHIRFGPRATIHRKD